LLFSFATFSLVMSAASAYEPQTLEIGSQAPDFDLLGTDNKRYTLESFADKSILVVIFTTNHCPDAIASFGRMCRMSEQYSPRDVGFVAINGNDPQAVMLSEMRWTKDDDSFKSMKIVAAEHKFNLPYLYDGATQQVIKAYGGIATPHVFIFDRERRLRYTGRLDNGRRNPGLAAKSEARDALDAMLAGQRVPVATTRVFGCSIKWSDKRSLVDQAERAWKERPVSLALADVRAIKKLVANETPALRLINVWSTSCGPCLVEFSGLVKTYRRFQNHPFELITICLDPPTQRETVASFLQQKHAAVARRTELLLKKDGRESNNLLFAGNDLEDLAMVLDPEWTGAQPHTMLIAPGGQIIFRQTGSIELEPLRAAIVKYALANFLK
jgi:peroxiredoxin